MKNIKDFDLNENGWIEQNHFGDYLIHEEEQGDDNYRLWENHPENVSQGEPRYELEYFGKKNGYTWETIDKQF
ncbi:MAG: hypothetical protein ACTHY0_02210 [Mammaliicoccus vitulinus]